jgi:hypothetical protein
MKNKRKLREWELPMNLSEQEKKMYGLDTKTKLNNTLIKTK